MVNIKKHICVWIKMHFNLKKIRGPHDKINVIENKIRVSWRYVTRSPFRWLRRIWSAYPYDKKVYTLCRSSCFSMRYNGNSTVDSKIIVFFLEKNKRMLAHHENSRDLNVGRLEIRRGFQNFSTRCAYVMRGNIMVVNRFSLAGWLQAPLHGVCRVVLCIIIAFTWAHQTTCSWYFAVSPSTLSRLGHPSATCHVRPLLSPSKRFVEFHARCTVTSYLPSVYVHRVGTVTLFILFFSQRICYCFYFDSNWFSLQATVDSNAYDCNGTRVNA